MTEKEAIRKICGELIENGYHVSEYDIRRQIGEGTLLTIYTEDKERQDRFLLDCLKAERDAIAAKATKCAEPYSTDSVRGFDASSCIWGFLESSFIKDEGSEVFVSDAHEVFVERYGLIESSVFSLDFVHFANQLYGATRTRKRKKMGANPESCLIGIKFIG